MLYQIFYRIWAVGTIIGTSYQIIHATFIRQPFTDLSPMYGVVWMVGFGAFWMSVWAITPKRWWD